MPFQAERRRSGLQPDATLVWLGTGVEKIESLALISTLVAGGNSLWQTESCIAYSVWPDVILANSSSSGVGAICANPLKG